MSKHIHLCMDVRGAIKNRSFAGFSNDDGSPASHAQVLEFLLDHVAKGHKVIPMGDCDNFDFQTGCGGHEEPDEIEPKEATA